MGAPLVKATLTRAIRVEAKRLLGDAISLLREADGRMPKSERKCSLCDATGHYALTCPAPRVLLRCQVIEDQQCQALVWERDMAMHLHDHHDIRTHKDKLPDYFEEVQKSNGKTKR